MVFNIVNITSFKLADVVDEGLPLTWDADLKLKLGTATLTVPEITTTAQYTEQNRAPYAQLLGNIEDPNIVGELALPTLEQLAELYNATYSAADATDAEMMKISSSSDPIEKAIEITGLTSEGEKVVVAMPRAQIVMSISGTLTKTEARGAMFKGHILNPKSGDDFVYIKVGEPTA